MTSPLTESMARHPSNSHLRLVRTAKPGEALAVVQRCVPTLRTLVERVFYAPVDSSERADAQRAIDLLTEASHRLLHQRFGPWAFNVALAQSEAESALYDLGYTSDRLIWDENDAANAVECEQRLNERVDQWVEAMLGLAS